MYVLSEVTRARVDVWATSPPSQTAVARDSCASRGQELRLDPQARWPKPPRAPAPEGSDSMCGCGRGPALHRGGGSRSHPHHGAAATPRMGDQGSPNLLSSPAESGTNQTPGWSRPGLGPPPASLPSLPPAGWRRWRRGSQRQALCPDHHAASPAGPRVRAEGSGGCILRGSSCKCLWDVTRDSGGWRQAPCHCSNCPGAGRVSRLSDITHLPEAFPAGPLQPQARPAPPRAVSTGGFSPQLPALLSREARAVRGVWGPGEGETGKGGGREVPRTALRIRGPGHTVELRAALSTVRQMPACRVHTRGRRKGSAPSCPEGTCRLGQRGRPQATPQQLARSSPRASGL